MEIVRIPFEGKEIVGYLRLPRNASGLVPLVLSVNGLDSRKEDLAESFSAILPFGVGYLAVDRPGTDKILSRLARTPNECFRECSITLPPAQKLIRTGLRCMA